MSLWSWSGLKGVADVFFCRGSGQEDVRPGTTFRCVHEDDLVETAEVESVRPDHYGIPHVKFTVNFSRRNRFSYDEGTRTLALQSFMDRYREQVTA